MAPIALIFTSQPSFSVIQPAFKLFAHFLTFFPCLPLFKFRWIRNGIFRCPFDSLPPLLWHSRDLCTPILLARTVGSIVFILSHKIFFFTTIQGRMAFFPGLPHSPPFFFAGRVRGEDFLVFLFVRPLSLAWHPFRLTQKSSPPNETPAPELF